MNSFDPEHVRRTLTLLHNPGDLIELRHAINSGTRAMKGYFFDYDQIELAVKLAKNLDGEVNVFSVLNEIRPDLPEHIDELLANRRGNEKMPTLTGNDHIVRRRWLFLDFDPCRAKGSASTEEQLNAAQCRAKDVIIALQEQGWPRPLRALSGNGVHVLWRVDMPVTEENRAGMDSLFEAFNSAVGYKWGDDALSGQRKKAGLPVDRDDDGRPLISVDPVIHNAARICKLWGTKSTKGDPALHRYSRIVDDGDDTLVTTEQMAAVIDAWGETKKAVGRPRNASNSASGKPDEKTGFDMASWLVLYDVTFTGTEREADRTKYILAECPWKDDHTTPDGPKDAVVWLADNGQRQFDCKHGHCVDRTWADFRAAVDPAYAAKLAVTKGDLPTVQVNGRRAIDILMDTVAAIAANNTPPTLFQSHGHLVALRQDQSGLTTLAPLDLDGLRVEAIKRISFVVETKTGIVASWPSADLLKSVQVLGRWDGIPECDLVTSVPLVAPDGTIHSKQGYSPITRAYLTTDAYAAHSTPQTITQQEAQQAVQFLFEWPLSGFPFDSEASKVHSVAAILQHYVLRVIDANSPMYLLAAPTPGSGKGLLAEFISNVAGTTPAVIALPEREEERAKTIGATLAARPSHILIDNVKGNVDSAALESALTTRVYSARILGTSNTMHLPTTSTTWMMAANNASMSTDMVTRTCYIRLDPKCEKPTERTDFLIPDLPSWTEANRAACVDACLTIIGYWVGQGMPLYAGDQSFARYSRWTAVIGGILEAVGLGASFLANRSDLAAASDYEGDAWHGFVEEWAADKGGAELEVGGITNPVSASDLMDLAFGEPTDGFSGLRKGGPLDGQIQGQNDASRKSKLGLALRKQHGRIYAGYQISYVSDPKHGGTAALRKVEDGLQRQETAEAKARPASPQAEANVLAGIGRPKRGGIFDGVAVPLAEEDVTVGAL